MMKAFSFFLLLFALASTQGFSQANSAASEQVKTLKEQPVSETLEASITPQEQAERDMLVPRKYQEQLAAEASKPIKYGPSTAPRKKTYYRSSAARKKAYSKSRRR